MNKSIFASAVLVATLAVAPAHAGVIFSENFDALGTVNDSDLNFAGFPTFTVGGQVDLVNSVNPYGITCSGKCVDLDGTSGPGSLLSSAIAFSAGGLVTVSFDLSGSQRSSDSDPFAFVMAFANPTNVLALTTLSGYPGSPSLLGDFAGLISVSYSPSVAGTAPFTTYSLSFLPTEAGSFTLSFATSSADNVGPILDNVLATQNAVPEPATWAMMIGGFALAGAAMRRRAGAVSFA